MALDASASACGTVFVIKTAIADRLAATFAFTAQKTMYGAKHIAAGDALFVFASNADGPTGLVASAVVTSAKAIAKTPGLARQTPRVSVEARRTALVERSLGRDQLKAFAAWHDGRPQTELNFRLYRQATDKVVGISDEAAAFLLGFF